MNEYITGLMIVFSQVGAVLAIAAVVMVIFVIRRKQKDNSVCKSFIELLKNKEGGRKDGIIETLQKVHQMDEELAEKTAKSMLTNEKKIYNNVLKLFMGHDRDALAGVQKDVESMANAYRKLMSNAETTQVVERGDNPKQLAQLRAALKQVSAERDKVQEDLDEAMQSMENMLKEYTQMYSGGGAKKEGLKHIENELGQLKQKIEENLVEVDGDEEEDIPDITPPESSSSGEEEAKKE